MREMPDDVREPSGNPILAIPRHSVDFLCDMWTHEAALRVPRHVTRIACLPNPPIVLCSTRCGLATKQTDGVWAGYVRVPRSGMGTWSKSRGNCGERVGGLHACLSSSFLEQSVGLRHSFSLVNHAVCTVSVLGDGEAKTSKHLAQMQVPRLAPAPVADMRAALPGRRSTRTSPSPFCRPFNKQIYIVPRASVSTYSRLSGRRFQCSRRSTCLLSSGRRR